jgi:phosphoglycolate phosphatase-like HAD superfamily hydrolase
VRRKLVTTLILDFDNTLFDWLRIWYGTFSVLRAEIVARMGDEMAADNAIRRVHQSNRTSEYRYLFEALFEGSDRGTRPPTRTVARRATRLDGLYPEVISSLQEIRKHGTRIVVCTESMERYSTERIFEFGLDGVIDVLFCNRDHPDRLNLPASETVRVHLSKTEVRHISEGRSKPDPEILREILKFLGAPAAQTAYVGDSIARDMRMAQEAGVTGLHARYGDTVGRDEFELLKRVSHWTDDDVRRENLGSHAFFEDGATLDTGFRDIFRYLTFSAFEGAAIRATAK